MDFFSRILWPGATVVEVGGHIGYLSMYFAELVGPNGQVIVFEPGTNNLPYIRRNVADLPQVTLVDKAVSDTDGVADFFEEELTGQNNSLFADYSVFEANCRRAFSGAKYNQHTIRTVRLDTFISEAELRPDLIKIDIEGAELLALEGASELLTSIAPVLLVEVTDRRHQVFDLLCARGYGLFSDAGKRLMNANQLDGNVCALHLSRHQEHLSRLGWASLQAA